MSAPLSAPSQASRAVGAAFIFKKAVISAFVALVLFSLMIGVRTEAGPQGQLIYWTRFGDLASLVAAVFPFWGCGSSTFGGATGEVWSV